MKFERNQPLQWTEDDGNGWSGGGGSTTSASSYAKAEPLSASFIPPAYINQIEKYYLESGAVIGHNVNGTNRLVQRGERLDWNNNFYERPLPNHAINSVKENTRKGIPKDAINCYIKD